jgi:hypothetical protein
MRELEGRSYHEISGVLGVSVSAVEALLFRARRNLQVGRRELGVLTTVPLPGSLASFIGGGGGAAVAGSAIGAEVVLKAAAVVAIGAATAGAGYRSVQALTAPQAAVRASAVAPKPASNTNLDRTAAATRSSLRQGPAAPRAATGAQAGRGRAEQQPRLPPDGPRRDRCLRPSRPRQRLSLSSPVVTPPALSTPQLPTPQLPPPPVAIPPVPPLPVTVPIPPLPPLPPPPPIK